MKKLRTVVAGIGRIGWQYHVPQVVVHDGFELIGVVDHSTERLQEAFDEYGVKGYQDYNEMLENEKPDLIVIATPTLFHADQAVAAMERGIDVFLDKPMARNLKEADRIVEAQQRTGRKVMLYQPHRMTAQALVLQEILKKDLIGPIYKMHVAISNYRRRNDWQSLKKNGGGMLNNYGSHRMDWLLSMADSDIKRIRCNMFAIATLGDAEDVVKIVMETESGMLFELDINEATAFDLPELVVYGKYGTIKHVAGENGENHYHVKYFREDGLGDIQLHGELAAPQRSYSNFETIVWNEETFPIPRREYKDAYYDKCYEYFALDEAPFVPLEHSYRVMEMLQKCREDAGWAE